MIRSETVFQIELRTLVSGVGSSRNLLLIDLIKASWFWDILSINKILHNDRIVNFSIPIELSWINQLDFVETYVHCHGHETTWKKN